MELFSKKHRKIVVDNVIPAIVALLGVLFLTTLEIFIIGAVVYSLVLCDVLYYKFKGKIYDIKDPNGVVTLILALSFLIPFLNAYVLTLVFVSTYLDKTLSNKEKLITNRRALCITFIKGIPLIKFGLKEQLDMDIQPLVAVFYNTKTKGKRVFTFTI